jgi:hypothetical protein
MISIESDFYYVRVTDYRTDPVRVIVLNRLWSKEYEINIYAPLNKELQKLLISDKQKISVGARSTERSLALFGYTTKNFIDYRDIRLLGDIKKDDRIRYESILPYIGKNISDYHDAPYYIAYNDNISSYLYTLGYYNRFMMENKNRNRVSSFIKFLDDKCHIKNKVVDIIRDGILDFHII